jgi:O-antigen/teichoic acid export membrane protein
MSLKQKALKGVIWSAIQSWGSQAISFLVFALLSRLLEPKTFGLVAMASVFLAFIQIFIDQGFSTAIIQRQKLSPSHLDTAFWTNIVMGSFMTLIGIAGSGVVANFFKQEQLTPIIACLSLSFLFNALSSVQEAIFRRNLNFKPLALRTLLAMCIGGSVGVTMAFKGFGVWSLVGQQLTGGFSQVLILWRVSDWRPGFKISRTHFQELFAFGINIVGINILNFINRRSDDLLIGYFLGPTALGYYAIAYTLLLNMTQLLTSVLSQVAMPAFSRLQHELEKLRGAFYTVTELISFIAFPAFTGVIVLAPELIEVLFGKQWSSSIPVIQVLSVVGIMHAIGYPQNAATIAMGKPSWQLKMNCLNAITNFIGFAIAVRWGIVAVAAAYSIRACLFLPISSWIIYKLIKIDFSIYLSKLTAPLFCSLITAIVVWLTKNFINNLTHNNILLIFYVILGLGVYTCLILLIAPRLFRQIIGFKRLLGKS